MFKTGDFTTYLEHQAGETWRERERDREFSLSVSARLYIISDMHALEGLQFFFLLFHFSI